MALGKGKNFMKSKSANKLQIGEKKRLKTQQSKQTYNYIEPIYPKSVKPSLVIKETKLKIQNRQHLKTEMQQNTSKLERSRTKYEVSPLSRFKT